MKKRVLLLSLFFTLRSQAIEVSDFSGVQIQFKQPISFGLGKYAEDGKAVVQKGEVQYLVNYDAVIKAKDEDGSAFCTLSITKVIKHKSLDYAQASSEIIDQLHQKKTISLEAGEVLFIKEAGFSHQSIRLKLESKKENRFVADCMTPAAKEDAAQTELVENMLSVLTNNQAKLTKKGKDFPSQGKKP